MKITKAKLKQVIQEELTATLQESPDDWESFGFPREETAPSSEDSSPDHYTTLVNLAIGDKFTIGQRKPVFRIVGAPREGGKAKGSPIKSVVIDGSGERKAYTLKRTDLKDAGIVGAFEVLWSDGSQSDADMPYRGITGHVVPLGV